MFKKLSAALSLTGPVANAVVLSLTFSTFASAESLLDRIRAYDLNDYAFGAVVSTTPSLYKGVDDSTIAYPYLTSVRELALTNDWFVIDEGDLGFRMIRGHWTVGGVGRIQTLGFDESDELSGVNQRKWAIEVAPEIAYRRFPVKVKLKPYFELTDRHEGVVSQLEFSYPIQGDWGYITPAIEFEAMSDDYTGYYFGVTSAETSGGINAYEPDDALNTHLKVSWGYYLSDHWILSGRAVWKTLDDSIKDSPLTKDDDDWLVSMGLAYNADFFPPSSPDPVNRSTEFSLRFTALENRIDTRYSQSSLDGVPGSRIDMEELLGLSDKETVYQYDAMFRFLQFHRIEVSYTEMDRKGQVSLENSFDHGETRFNENTQLLTEIDSDSLRFSYGFSLIRDQQKELGVSVGLHRTRMDTAFIVPGTGKLEQSQPDPVLPTFGAFGSVALGVRTRVMADVNFFSMDMDRYDGSMVTARLGIFYNLGMANIGAGYSYYSVNLDSTHEDHPGELDFTHQGPTLSLDFSL